MSDQVREWIVQRCLNAFRDEYEDWPGYCEKLLTCEEMNAALVVCAERWPEYGFRGHKVANHRSLRPTLRLVK